MSKQPKRYSPHRRANQAFLLAFGIPPLLEYTDEDDLDTCEQAVMHFLSYVLHPDSSNPLKRKFPEQNMWELYNWFNKKYPSTETK